jgi:hypothetical protein
VQAQWRAAVDILETTRNFADGTLCGAGGKFDTLLQALEGEYTPAALSEFVATVRSGASSLVTQGMALAAITPCLFEYGKLLAADATLGFGSGYRTAPEIFRALYEWFHANTLTVKSRAITYDTSATTAGLGAAGAIQGNGAMSRLTVDEHNYNLEACHVEKKTFRCRSDQNSGTDKWAEVFEFVGTAASYDSLLRAANGSGESARSAVISKHAGTGQGGSNLTNSSFSEYSATATPKFTAWTESAGGAYIAQDTTHYYRSHPGSQLDAALKITGGSGTVTLKQTLANMRVRKLDPDRPYFLRVMLNKTIGTASGGTVTLRLGSKSVSVTIAGLASNWAELMIPMTSDCWFRNFDENAFDVEIEWSSSTSGYLLVDDLIFAPFDLVDGTYWCLRQNAATPTAWLVDDTLTFTDTGGAPATGKIQWWCFVAGLGYLPANAVTITFTDP